jgi:hypothetical protein
MELHGQQISAELATADAAPERGLMARTTLIASRGMMFVFAATVPRACWMRNTLVPLDIPYFDDVRQPVSAPRDTRPCMAILARFTRAPAQRATCWNHHRYGTTFRHAAWRSPDDERSHRRGAARASEPVFRNIDPMSGTERKPRTGNPRKSW